MENSQPTANQKHSQRLLEAIQSQVKPTGLGNVLQTIPYWACLDVRNISGEVVINLGTVYEGDDRHFVMQPTLTNMSIQRGAKTPFIWHPELMLGLFQDPLDPRSAALLQYYCLQWGTNPIVGVHSLSIFSDTEQTVHVGHLCEALEMLQSTEGYRNWLIDREEQKKDPYKNIDEQVFDGHPSENAPTEFSDWELRQNLNRMQAYARAVNMGTSIENTPAAIEDKGGSNLSTSKFASAMLEWIRVQPKVKGMLNYPSPLDDYYPTVEEHGYEGPPNAKQNDTRKYLNQRLHLGILNDSKVWFYVVRNPSRTAGFSHICEVEGDTPESRSELTDELVWNTVKPLAPFDTVMARSKNRKRVERSDEEDPPTEGKNWRPMYMLARYYIIKEYQISGVEGATEDIRNMVEQNEFIRYFSTAVGDIVYLRNNPGGMASGDGFTPRASSSKPSVGRRKSSRNLFSPSGDYQEGKKNHRTLPETPVLRNARSKKTTPKYTTDSDGDTEMGQGSEALSPRDLDRLRRGIEEIGIEIDGADKKWRRYMEKKNHNEKILRDAEAVADYTRELAQNAAKAHADAQEAYKKSSEACRQALKAKEAKVEEHDEAKDRLERLEKEAKSPTPGRYTG